MRIHRADRSAPGSAHPRSRMSSQPPRLPAASMPDAVRMQEVVELVERLAAMLRDRAARATADASSREALELIEKLLDVLGRFGRTRQLRALDAALRVVRDRLKGALGAEHELTVAGAQLRDLWAELSPAVTSRGRFWDTV
jgi:hypothetical protein